MNCPQCGSPVAEGDAFCGVCGAGVSQQAAPQQPESPQLPTPEIPPVYPGEQPAPLSPAEPPPVPPVAPGPVPPPVYAAQPTAPMPPQPHPAPAWSAQPAPLGAPETPKKSKAPLVIAIVVGILLLCGCVAAAGVVAFMQVRQAVDDAGGVIELPAEPGQPGEPQGFATPEEAAQSMVPDGWVYDIADDQGDVKEYWTGPPASEWVTAIVVERLADGSWQVAETYELGASDVPASDEEMALYTVEEFLYAVMDDRPADAQALTAPPFSNDPASAQVSNGQFSSFEVEGVKAATGGSYWVTVTEVWTFGTDTWRYRVAPVSGQWRIVELSP